MRLKKYLEVMFVDSELYFEISVVVIINNIFDSRIIKEH